MHSTAFSEPGIQTMVCFYFAWALFYLYYWMYYISSLYSAIDFRQPVPALFSRPHHLIVCIYGLCTYAYKFIGWSLPTHSPLPSLWGLTVCPCFYVSASISIWMVFLNSKLTAILCVSGMILPLEERKVQTLGLTALSHNGMKRCVRASESRAVLLWLDLRVNKKDPNFCIFKCWLNSNLA